MKTVLVFGGSGFIGRSVVRQLSEGGYHVIVPTRHRERVKDELIVLPNVDLVACDPFEPSAAAKLLERSDYVINLVGILHESRRHSFEQVHVEKVRLLVDSIANVDRVKQIVHVSALHAMTGAPSRYLRSKGKGEAFVTKTSRAKWTIIQPSVVFGDGDGLLGLFAKVLRYSPLVMLPMPDARFQPIFVEDLARLIVGSIGDPAAFEKARVAVGPEVLTMREIVSMLSSLVGPKRRLFGLGKGVSKMMATVMEYIPFMPPLLTRDNLASMSLPSVAKDQANDAEQYAVDNKLMSVRNYLMASRAKRRSLDSFSEFRHVARRG